MMHCKPLRVGTIIGAAILAVSACTAPTPAPQDRGGTSPPAAAASQPLRTMTFNIRYGTAPDGMDAWPNRRELVFRVIREFEPDVLGLQEALRFQLDEIVQVLPGFARIGVGRDDGAERGEFSAILYDSTRLALLEHGTFWLSDSPEVPGSMTWGNQYPRLVTWARFRDRAQDARFYVYNTHWDHESQHARERSARLMIERIRGRAQPDEPIIVMGDFNAGEDNVAFRALLATQPGGPGDGRLYDTFRAVHPDAPDTGTYHAFRGDCTGPKIDAILASRSWLTIGAAIVLDHEDGRYPSDHFPVTATLLLTVPAPPHRPQP